MENQAYIFYATAVTPLSGRQQFLTSEYTLDVSKDSLVSYLPYFGKAYAVPIGATDGGIKFTATKFDYKMTPQKKRWLGYQH